MASFSGRDECPSPNLGRENSPSWRPSRVCSLQRSGETGSELPKTILHLRVEAYEVGGQEDQLANRRERVDHSERRKLIGYVPREFRVTASDEVEHDYERVEHVSQPVEWEIEVGS